MKRIELTKELATEIYERYSSGASLMFLEKEYKINRKILSRELQKLGFSLRNNGRKHSLNEKYFSVIDSSEKAYWLGFIAADGGINRTGNNKKYNNLTINLNQRDYEHLEKFLKAVNSDDSIKLFPGVGYGEGTIIASISLNSVAMVEDLINLGIVPKKSLVLLPPNINKIYYRDWIRGYIDGDGSISLLKNGEAQLSVLGTKKVVSFIKDFLSPEKDKRFYQYGDKNTYELSYGGTASIVNYLHQIYDNATIYLDRKYQKVLEVYSRFEK